MVFKLNFNVLNVHTFRFRLTAHICRYTKNKLQHNHTTIHIRMQCKRNGVSSTKIFAMVLPTSIALFCYKVCQKTWAAAAYLVKFHECSDTQPPPPKKKSIAQQQAATTIYYFTTLRYKSHFVLIISTSPANLVPLSACVNHSLLSQNTKGHNTRFLKSKQLLQRRQSWQKPIPLRIFDDKNYIAII